MGTNYPGAADQFSEPTEPEGTPLSEAGTGTRNHYEHHRDLGDSVESLQANAALKGHDHDGQGTPAHGYKLIQANTHESPDTDASTDAIHHTLGPGATQAAPGNHCHDYDGGTILNRPYIRCTSSTRPTDPSLGLVIYEKDTKRFRIWDQFTQSNIANQGVYGVDDFERTSDTSLGSDWSQTYLPNTDGGVMATPNGHDAAWIFDYDGFSWPWIGWPYEHQQGRCIARRTKTIDQHTITDDQMITWESGTRCLPWFWPWPPTPSGNDFYLRMSDDGQSYIRVSFTYNPFTAFYTPFNPPARGHVLVYATQSGPADEEMIGSLATFLPAAYAFNSIVISGRELTFYWGSQFVGKVVDRNEVSAKGAAYRGWGIGMTVGRHSDWPWGQHSHPSDLHRVEIKDPVYYTGNPIWQMLPMGAIPVCRLRQAFRQQLVQGGTVLSWNEVLEDPFGFFNSAHPTDIVIKEPGVYAVECGLQWDPQWAPDIAHVVLCLNGQDTTVRQSQFMRGNLFHPGFSQTLYTHGKVRFAANDVLSVRSAYTAGGGLLGQILSWWDSPSNVKSRLDLTFVGP